MLRLLSINKNIIYTVTPFLPSSYATLINAPSDGLWILSVTPKLLLFTAHDAFPIIALTWLVNLVRLSLHILQFSFRRIPSTCQTSVQILPCCSLALKLTGRPSAAICFISSVMTLHYLIDPSLSQSRFNFSPSLFHLIYLFFCLFILLLAANRWACLQSSMPHGQFKAASGWNAIERNGTGMWRLFFFVVFVITVAVIRSCLSSNFGGLLTSIFRDTLSIIRFPCIWVWKSCIWVL